MSNRKFFAVFLCILQSLLLVSPANARPPNATAAENVEVVNILVPAYVLPNQAFRPSVIVQLNNGQQLLESRGDMLRHYSGPDYVKFPHIAVLGSVNSGSQYTFTFYADNPMVAPGVSGLYETTYRVWAAGQWVGPEIIIRFGVNQPPADPSPLSPLDGTTLHTTAAPQVCWNAAPDPEGDAVQYFAQTIEQPIIATSGWIAETCWTISELAGRYGDYRWRVKARDSKGFESNQGSQWTFNLRAPVTPTPTPTDTPTATPTDTPTPTTSPTPTLTLTPSPTTTPTTPTLSLSKFTNVQSAARNQVVDFTLVLSLTNANAPTLVEDMLPAGLSYLSQSSVPPATFSAAQNRLSWTVNTVGSQQITLTYQARIASDVPDGAILSNLATAASDEMRADASSAIAVPDPLFRGDAMLIYANGDNNLSANIMQLLNRAEQAADNSKARIWMMLDGPETNDAWAYRVQADSNLACPSYSNPFCKRYIEGKSVFRWTDNSADPRALAEFIRSAILTYPNAHAVHLAIVGHGDGWSPDLPLGQPNRPPGGGGQPGGLLSDLHPFSSLSTYALSNALQWGLQGTGRAKLDLLYLDACLMSTVEVAYQLRDKAKHLLSAESWNWSLFPYHAHIGAIDGVKDSAALGREWLAQTAEGLRTYDYPFVLSLVDLSKIEAVKASLDVLATDMQTALPQTNLIEIRNAFGAADGFDIDQDGDIDNSDYLRDIASFARQIKQRVPTTAAAADTVIAAVREATVVDFNNGQPFADQNDWWTWEGPSGLSIYLPLHKDDWKRRYYKPHQIDFARDTRWAGWLNAFWGAAQAPLPPCDTPNCAQSPSPIGVAAIALDARGGLGSVRLDWVLTEPALNFTRYEISRTQLGLIESYTAISSTRLAAYVDRDEDLIAKEIYCYRVSALNSQNQVLLTSNRACTTFGRVEFWVPHVPAPEEAIAEVPINVLNGDGLCAGSIDLALEIQPSVLQPLNLVAQTAYADGYKLKATVNGNIVRVQHLGDCRSLHGSGSLGIMHYQVLGREGVSSTVKFVLGDEGSRVTTNQVPPAEVPVRYVDGSVNVVNAFVKGDVNRDNRVQLTDAQLAMQISAGLLAPTTLQIAACDITGDGRCTAADASLIQCYAESRTWSKCQFPVLARSVASAANEDGEIGVCIRPEVDAATGNHDFVIELDGAADLASADLTFAFDSAQASFISATSSALTTTVNSTLPGLLRVSMSGPSNWGRSHGELLWLRVTPTTATTLPTISLLGARMFNAVGLDIVSQSGDTRHIQLACQSHAPLVWLPQLGR